VGSLLWEISCFRLDLVGFSPMKARVGKTPCGAVGVANCRKDDSRSNRASILP